MKQLLILSGKGGTGKTTLATAFIKLAEAKAFADCDVDAPNLHLVINQSSKPQETDYYGLPKAKIDLDLCKGCDLCRQECRFNAIKADAHYIVDQYACEGCGLCEVICPEGAISLNPAIAGNLMLYKGNHIFSTARLKMGSGTSGMLVSEVKKQMQSAIDFDSTNNVELAIIYGSPGIGCAVIASISGVDLVLIVAEPSVSGINDMERIVKTARSFQTQIAVCVNKWDVNMENTKMIEAFCENNDLPFVGKIPFDKDAVRAINNGLSIIDMDCISGHMARQVFNKTLRLLS